MVRFIALTEVFHLVLITEVALFASAFVSLRSRRCVRFLLLFFFTFPFSSLRFFPPFVGWWTPARDIKAAGLYLATVSSSMRTFDSFLTAISTGTWMLSVGFLRDKPVSVRTMFL